MSNEACFCLRERENVRTEQYIRATGTFKVQQYLVCSKTMWQREISVLCLLTLVSGCFATHTGYLEILIRKPTAHGDQFDPVYHILKRTHHHHHYQHGKDEHLGDNHESDLSPHHETGGYEHTKVRKVYEIRYLQDNEGGAFGHHRSETDVRGRHSHINSHWPYVLYKRYGGYERHQRPVLHDEKHDVLLGFGEQEAHSLNSDVGKDAVIEPLNKKKEFDQSDKEP